MPKFHQKRREVMKDFKPGDRVYVQKTNYDGFGVIGNPPTDESSHSALNERWAVLYDDPKLRQNKVEHGYRFWLDGNVIPAQDAVSETIEINWSIVVL